MKKPSYEMELVHKNKDRGIIATGQTGKPE